MKKYIKSSILELKDGSTENITSPDDFKWLIEDRLGSECADYFDAIIEDLLWELDETLPYLEEDYTKKVIIDSFKNYNYSPLNLR